MTEIDQEILKRALERHNFSGDDAALAEWVQMMSDGMDECVICQTYRVLCDEKTVREWDPGLRKYVTVRLRDGAVMQVEEPTLEESATLQDEPKTGTTAPEVGATVVDEGGESILQEAHRLTHGARNKDYGHPLDDYTRTARMFSALMADKLKEPLTAADMAMAMMCVKLSRQANSPKRDNMTDAAGYAWVVQACHEEEARRATSFNPRKETTTP